MVCKIKVIWHEMTFVLPSVKKNWYRPNTRIFLHSKIQPSSFKTVDWKELSDFVICKMIVIWHEMTFVLLIVKKCFRSLLEFNVTFHQQKS